jgi:hypothetical protein
LNRKALVVGPVGTISSYQFMFNLINNTENYRLASYLYKVVGCGYCRQEGMSMRREDDVSDGSRGPISAPLPGTTTITLRLDHTVLAWFHAQVHAQSGGHDQTLIHRALLDDIAEQAQGPVKSDCGTCGARSCRVRTPHEPGGL